MLIRKCKVMYGRDHLATVSALPDGRWELQPTETHLPIELMSMVRLFDPYTGRPMPPLVLEWLNASGITLTDQAEPIRQLIALTRSSQNGIRFVQEGR